MNRIFKVIWSKVHNSFVAVSEIAKSVTTKSGKSTLSSARLSVSGLFKMKMIALSILLSSQAMAAPSGFDPVYGNTTVNTVGNVTNINQTTDKAIVNWGSFDIAAGETVNVYQPSGGSALYRIIGNDSTSIYVINRNRVWS